MLTIIVATGQNPAFHGLDDYLPVPLIPLADRPFLQHIIEFLVRQGIRNFDFVLSHLPEKIEEAFGDGARWGCSFHYHLSPSPEDALRIAAGIISGTAEEVLLASGTFLPAVELSDFATDSLLTRDGLWTGWGRLASGSGSSGLLATLTPGRAIPAGTSAHEVTVALSLETGEEFLRAQRAAMDGTFPGLMIAGKEVDPQVWICRNVAIHPSATITPPVYIGENCRVGKGSHVGPSAVIGSNCIVDAQSIVVNSMVTAGTYVGEGLELDSVIVDRNRLVNLRLGTSVLISETFLLGSLIQRSRGRMWQGLRDRLAALILLLILWPLLVGALLYLKVTRRGKLAVKEAVNIPADDNPSGWSVSRVLRFQRDKPSSGSEFWSSFLPGLVSVLLGHLFLVGVQPRTRSEIESLPADWRSLYLKSKAGLITESAVMFGPAGTPDEIYTCEAFYSATESNAHDLKLISLWMRGLFSRPGVTDTKALADYPEI